MQRRERVTAGLQAVPAQRIDSSLRDFRKRQYGVVHHIADHPDAIACHPLAPKIRNRLVRRREQQL